MVRPVHGSPRTAALALMAGALVGCFTGDALLGQPCKTDDDCNAAVDVSGGHIVCSDGICGALCGDGIQADGAEQCDDGNNIDIDACVGCKLATCGDDVTHSGVEECDDGNNIDTDACVGCKLATCGDGVVWAGEEECDEQTDVCTDCLRVACGDGRLDPATEVCDDSNLIQNDGCNTRCEQGSEAIAGGLGSHTCALRQAALRCWGDNTYGQLGYGSTASVGDELQDLPPADIVLDHDVLAVAVGAGHTCALLDVGGDNLRCWGSNEFGQLGLPGTSIVGDERDESLVTPVKLGGPALDIVAGDRHTCARMAGGAVRCWGDNTYGQLGHPGGQSIGEYEDPATFPVLAVPPVRQLSAGGHHTCALLDADRSVVCWGRNFSFQLGFDSPGTVVSDPTKAEPVALGLAVAMVTAGSEHTCALLAATRAVHCWGGGDGNEEPAPGIRAVDLGGRPVEQVRASALHTCAVVTDGDVWCWGRTILGTHGLGEPDPNASDAVSLPVRMKLNGRATDVAPGAAHTCVRFDGGAVGCWGHNASGQLALGHMADRGLAPGDWPPPAAILYPSLAGKVGP